MAMLIALLLAAAPVQTQSDANRQAGGDLARADAGMNAQYRAAMLRMKQRDVVPERDPRWHQPPGPNHQNALLASQRAWLVFRDAECVIEGYAFRGGSAQGMAVAQCKAALTRARIAQLRTLTR